MKPARVGTLLLCLVLSAPLYAEPQTRYTNAELVSINAQARQVVIKDTDGREQRLQLDDSVGGLDGLRAGDRVILSLREEPGMTRIRSIVKSQASPSVPVARADRPTAAPTAATAPALAAFAERVAALAEEAGRVDAIWSHFAATCNVTLRSSYPDGRDWFSLWVEGAAQVDLSSGVCRDLFNQVVARGESVKGGMVAAEEAARKAGVSPGEVRDARRSYSMEWGGFALPAPDPLEP
jgi:hypothetical protein